ncbi:MAG: c-type cytochrome biogenesis protein CcmI [Halieaceae bacterium]|nr:c-type cytochrome biogenesis protein CcmI [Halieaceae bacterium]
MTEFYFVCLLLLLLASVFILLPLLRQQGSGSAEHNRQHMNVLLYRQRLAELDSEFQRGRHSQEQYDELKASLERSLLADAEAGTSANGAATQGPIVWLALLLVLALPLSAWFSYQQLGAQADWQIFELLETVGRQNAAGEDSSESLRQLSEDVSSRLQQKPEHIDYWMLQASAAMALDNYAEAAAAFKVLHDLEGGDGGDSNANLLAQYAQALYLAADRQMTPQVQALSDRALQLDPGQPTLLSIYSFEQGQFAAAIDYWQRLLPTMNPDSRNAQMVRAGIEQARAQLPADAQPPAPQAIAVGAASLTLAVALPADLQADPDASVFVFARPLQGSRMPLAVARLKVADLPATVVLDDSMAMTQAMRLSAFEEVEVIARISKQGIANPGPGDIEGRLTPVVVGASSKPLPLLIDRVIP